MQNFTIATGVFLVLVGVVSYVATGAASLTAFIPSVFGALLALCGQLGKDPTKTKLVMHLAVLLALLGFFGSVQGIPATLTLLSGGEVARPGAAVARAVMAITLVIFIVAAVRSFIQARRARA